MELPLIHATRLFVPTVRQKVVSRKRLLERLDAGLAGRLTLLSAPAGSGKTVLLADWLGTRNLRAVWVSLDASLGDPSTFLSFLIYGLQEVEAVLGQGVLEGLMSPYPPQPAAALEVLLQEIALGSGRLVLVLDDFHRLESPRSEALVGQLLEHLPSRVHLVLATREDPELPLARLRARGDLTELRMVDLKFQGPEAAEFLRFSMGLSLAPELVAVLDQKTEGWATGLQLAALSLANQPDPAHFVRTFAGSHRFVLDYLMEEVMKSLPDELQDFVLATSILDRLTADLCDAVTGRQDSRTMLSRLDQANLFLVSLDGGGQWFRFHHLFGDMLAQRRISVLKDSDLHSRASEWFASHGFGPEAFRHAVAAGDRPRAAVLVETDQIPSYERAAVTQVLLWLTTLPPEFLEERPLLVLRWASLQLFAGQTAGVEERATQAEAALGRSEIPHRQDLLGQAAALRATVAVTRYQPDAIETHAHRALELLDPATLNYRFTATSALGFSQQLKGDRKAALASYRTALSLAERLGERFLRAMALTNLGQARELDADPVGAGEAYQTVLDLMGAYPQPYACEASLGLARVRYLANDLDEAEKLASRSHELALQYDPAIDRFILAELFLARCAWARGDGAAAAQQLSRTKRTIADRGFDHRWTEWSAVEVDRLLALGDTDEAAVVAAAHPSPWTAIRVGLAAHRPGVLAEAKALAEEMRRREWADEALRAKILEAKALHQAGDTAEAGKVIADCRRVAGSHSPRLFVDEGLLTRDSLTPDPGSNRPEEVLSSREIEVLELVAQGFSNEAIAERLFVALSTIKGHNLRIFEKLQVSRRTEAVAVARRLGLLRA